MKVVIHEDEAVLNKKDAKNWRGGGNDGATFPPLQVIRDRTLDWVDRVMDSPMVARVIYGFIGFAAGYFLGIVVSKIQ